MHSDSIISISFENVKVNKLTETIITIHFFIEIFSKITAISLNHVLISYDFSTIAIYKVNDWFTGWCSLHTGNEWCLVRSYYVNNVTCLIYVLL